MTLRRSTHQLGVLLESTLGDSVNVLVGARSGHQMREDSVNVPLGAQRLCRPLLGSQVFEVVGQRLSLGMNSGPNVSHLKRTFPIKFQGFPCTLLTGKEQKVIGPVAIAAAYVPEGSKKNVSQARHLSLTNAPVWMGMTREIEAG